MNIEQILNRIPEYAKDIKLNLSSLVNNHGTMNDTQFYGTILASALASKNSSLTKEIEAIIKPLLDETNCNAVKSAANLMAMNNIYYRFTDLIEDPEYLKMSAGLRMNALRDHAGANGTDFEIWSLAVSVINGCSMCISSHAKQLEKQGVSRDTIQLTAKIAAIIHATARALENI